MQLTWREVRELVLSLLILCSLVSFLCGDNQPSPLVALGILTAALSAVIDYAVAAATWLATRLMRE